MGLQIGRIDIDQLLQELTTTQLREWMAYEKLEPFGQPAAELRHSEQACLLANINRNPKARKKAFTAEDFMYDYEGVLLGKRKRFDHKPTSQELVEKVKAVMSIFSR